MDGVLLLAHGSRAPETQQTLEAVADTVRELLPGCVIQTAFMQFCEMDIEKGLAALLERGVTNIKVVPYFLFSGVHIREDIPEALAEFRQAHPEVTITLGGTLGEDKRLAEIVADRITYFS